MLVTITNATTRTINKLAVGEDGLAAGGGNYPSEANHRIDALPYPFAHIGELAASGTKQLPMQPSDWRFQRANVPSGLGVSTAWNTLVQRGVITVAIAAQTTNRDVESAFITAV